ncbi:carbon-nitrogen hydrolase family protein [Thalassotalea marina]|uniref:Amidohydrolase n=1 Tax=Thalassotalea marina TaxID=1673741 RepID=A0A919BCV5_9GAMM|nr:carbon-nitrogen hydrolase family protein [Thalassotalea marina]GHF82931.1 amidohydrolase [Thalassotalea marina]
MIKLSAIQLSSSPNVQDNLATIERLMSQLPFAEQHIVVLPECCLFFGGTDRAQLDLAKQDATTNELKTGLSKLAKQYNVTLVAGSIPQYIEQQDKFYNTCCVFSGSGELLTQYHKMHLFDVDVNDSEKQYRESRYTEKGTSAITKTLDSLTLGLSICYDLRFPELYRHLTTLGAQVITVPAAFTKVTGKAHWLPLLQARAIENQVYIVAAGQYGVHDNGRETWGQSVIINPWGEVLSEITQGVGTISADFDLDTLQSVRQAIPVAQHNQFITKIKTL